jgi:competence protein ComEC
MWWLWLACVHREPGQMQAHVIDVGQGSATLLEFPCGAVLVDAGGERSAGFDSTPVLLGYLDRFFDRRPDLDHTLAALVLTHAHLDHTRGAPDVIARYRVRHLVTNGLEVGSGGDAQAKAHRQASQVQFVRADAIPRTGLTSAAIDAVGRCARSGVDPSLRALWGDDGQKGDGNDDSVVFRVDFGESSFVISGDLTDEAIPALIKEHGAMLDADAWVVGHHGARNGTTRPMLDALTPKLALISCGPPVRPQRSAADHTAYRFGHPNERVVRDLAAAVSTSRPATEVQVGQRGAQPGEADGSVFVPFKLDRAVYATGWDGTVVVTADAAGNLSVATERAP